MTDNNIKFAAPLDQVERLRAFVSTEEARFYLQGLHYSHGEDGAAVLAATDGRRLGVLRCEEAFVHGTGIVRLPVAKVKADYPNWRSVIPKAPGTPQGGFNASYMAAFTKASNGEKTVQVRLHGDSPNAANVVTIGDPNFVGVIMPMHGEDLSTMPGWLVKAAPEGQANEA